VGRSDAQRHFGTWRAVAGQFKIAVGDRWYIDTQIKPIQQWTRYAAQIIGAAVWGAGAGLCGVCQIATTTGVGSDDQHKATGIFHMSIGTRNHHLTRLNRLAQGL